MQNIKSKARAYNLILSKIDSVYHEIALKQGFADSIMSILYTLADNDGACLLSELIKQSSMPKQTVNSALRKLEKEQIIYLETINGKSKKVSLTEYGFSVAHKTVDKVIEIENKIYSSWTKDEWEIYMKLTEDFLNKLKKEVKEL